MVKGDAVFSGYANAPQLNEKVFDQEGFFHTGDLGYLVGNRLYFTGRCKQILVANNGENIEVEKIRELVKTADTNIKDVQLELKGQKLNCIIYCHRIEKKDYKKLIEEVNSKLLPFERKKEFQIVEDHRLKG